MVDYQPTDTGRQWVQQVAGLPRAHMELVVVAGEDGATSSDTQVVRVEYRLFCGYSPTPAFAEREQVYQLNRIFDWAEAEGERLQKAVTVFWRRPPEIISTRPLFRDPSHLTSGNEERHTLTGFTFTGFSFRCQTLPFLPQALIDDLQYRSAQLMAGVELEYPPCP